MTNNIKNLTTKERDFYLTWAGFTPREEALFLFRSKEGTLEEATELLHCSLSTVNRINKSVKRKIVKVSHMYFDT